MKQLIIPAILILIFSSLTLEAQWVQCSNGMSGGSVNSLLVVGSNIFAGTGSGVYVSSNTGDNWIQTSLNNRSIHSLAAIPNYIFASTINYGVYRSSDNGNTWAQTSLNGGSIQLLMSNGNVIYAAHHVLVFRSTDNGISWQVVFTSQNPDIGSLTSNGNTVFIGEHGVFYSANNGVSWTQTLNTNALIVNALSSNGNNVFAGSHGISRSIDNGLSWNQTSLNNVYINAVYAYGENIFAGTSDNGVYISNNNGTNWVQRSEGLNGPPSVVEDFCILNNYVFAGTWQHNVYRRQLSELVGVQPVSNIIPDEFSLSQNYPNPFNPSTKIRFDIPTGTRHSAFVQMQIFDILGRETATLVNEQLNPGTYEISWEASSYPSGVYYYKLQSDGFTQTKKMILLK